MKIAQEINKKCSDVLPFYKDISDFTLQTYNQGLDRLNNLYGLSQEKVNKVSKTSKQFRKDVAWMFSQASDDLLELMETKFQIDTKTSKEKDKLKRLKRVYVQLKERGLISYVQKLVQYNETLIAKGKGYHNKYIVPIYITIKATILVSREMFMEAFSERVSKLKMTYKCSKDSITMFWSGEFKEDKILEKVKTNLGSFKQFTINFVQKGLEIKISKQDLLENYHHVMQKLSEILNDVSTKSIEQWTETKTKTIDLYRSVLNRIKAKEREIRCSMTSQEPKPEEPKKVQDELKKVEEEPSPDVMKKEVEDLREEVPEPMREQPPNQEENDEQDAKEDRE